MLLQCQKFALLLFYFKASMYSIRSVMRLVCTDFNENLSFALRKHMVFTLVQ